MKNPRIVFSLVICCLSLSCNKDLPLKEQVPRPAPPGVQDGISVSNSAGLRIYEAIYQENPDSNLCVSPYSIQTLLSLIANGVEGKDLEEILRVLHLDNYDIGYLNANFHDLESRLHQVDPLVVYESANSFWYQKGIEVFHPFRKDLDYFYNSETYPVDFWDPGTLTLINNWASEKTHGKIPVIYERIPKGTVLNLINAIYFKGEWTNQFDKDRTRKRSFMKLDRTIVQMDAMNDYRRFKTYSHPSWLGVELPYGNEFWSMYLFMPRRFGSLDKLTSWLVDEFDNIRHEFEERYLTSLLLPRFKIRNNYDMIPYLKELGIKGIFEVGGHFCRMTSYPIYIDVVVHKTFIEVNEEGTEAAAVTGGGGNTGSPRGLYFDHPFVFVIAEKTTGLILFIGQVTDPTGAAE